MMPESEYQRDPESDGPDHDPDSDEDDFPPTGGGDEQDEE